MFEELCAGAKSALELSRILRVAEKEIYTHLEHVRRSAAARGDRFVMHPPRCLQCGFAFEERRRVTRPGRCPKCKGTHLERPTYEIEGKGR